MAQNGSISSSSIKGEAISMSMDISSKNLTIAQIGAIQGPQICQSPRSTGGNAARKRTGSSTHGARSSSCIEPSETAQRPKGGYNLSTPGSLGSPQLSFAKIAFSAPCPTRLL